MTTGPDLHAHRDRTVPDLLGDDVRLLVVGINPGLWTAAVGAHFARPGNRFYPALYLAGMSTRRIDATAGYDPADVADLTGRGIAITNLVDRATARADEIAPDELRQAPARLAPRVERWGAAVVCVVGVTAYRTAFRRPRAVRGEQPERLGGARLWVAGNPSGLNAHDQVPALARAYRAAAEAAGVTLDPPRW